MGQECRAHVSKCVYCKIRKAHTNNAKTPLQRFEIPPYPFYRSHIDVAGPFPMSKSGNRYIVVVKDALTKWVELYSVPNTKAETIAEVMFDEVVCR